MPDPKLKLAMEEIKAVLTKHDIAASVVLSSPTSIEYLRHPQASWNSLRIEEGYEGTMLRFRCQRADFPTVEAWRESMRLSIGTILGFADALESERAAFLNISKMVAGKMEVTHTTREEES